MFYLILVDKAETSILSFKPITLEEVDHICSETYKKFIRSLIVGAKWERAKESGEFPENYEFIKLNSEEWIFNDGCKMWKHISEMSNLRNLIKLHLRDYKIDKILT